MKQALKKFVESESEKADVRHTNPSIVWAALKSIAVASAMFFALSMGMEMPFEPGFSTTIAWGMLFSGTFRAATALYAPFFRFRRPASMFSLLVWLFALGAAIPHPAPILVVLAGVLALEDAAIYLRQGFE